MSTISESVTFPPGPVHESLYSVCSTIALEVRVPEVPVHESPFVAVTVQEVAFVELHVMVVVSPCPTSDGVALMSPVGAGAGLHWPVATEQPYWHGWAGGGSRTETLQSAFREQR